LNDIYQYLALIEAVQHPDAERIRRIAADYRDEMEGVGWTDARGGGSLGTSAYDGDYRSFAGECERHALWLANRLREAGFDAVMTDGEYVVDDPRYHEENERLEWETHFWVRVGPPQGPAALIVDVTADQYNPSNPTAYRVVVTTGKDPHYRD
jgi:hypothetical protein